MNSNMGINKINCRQPFLKVSFETLLQNVISLTQREGKKAGEIISLVRSLPHISLKGSLVSHSVRDIERRRRGDTSNNNVFNDIKQKAHE